MELASVRKFRVLCIDGGGMRGVYTAAYLNGLQSRFVKHRGLGEGQLDIGKGFDLIVGTSTGAIVGLGLAHGVAASKILELYREHGAEIFPLKMPTTLFGVLKQLITRPRALAAGDAKLLKALVGIFGECTVEELYKNRKIAFAIPAIDMQSRQAWVFKSKHLPGSFGRDDGYKLVDVCRATSAAPIYRSLAAVDNPDEPGHRVFVDGGLCANSPVLVGLLDALAMAEEDQEIEIYSLGTCKPPSGTVIPKEEVHKGLLWWKLGGVAAEISIDAQDKISSDMVRFLTRHLKRNVAFVKFPSEEAIGGLGEYLSLDETRPEALDALVAQAASDVNMTLSHCAEPTNDSGQRLKSLLEEIPLL